MRFSYGNRGKSHCARVCYVDFEIHGRIFLIMVFAKNEMENCISQVLKYHLNRYYATGVSDTEVEAFVRQEIRQQLHTASRVSIDVKSCDMVSGVISVRVTEDFVLPGGFHKSIACDKTILVETEVIEEETETEEIWPQEEEV